MGAGKCRGSRGACEVEQPVTQNMSRVRKQNKEGGREKSLKERGHFLGNWDKENIGLQNSMARVKVWET